MTNPESVRINKYLAHEGIATRREADRLIEQGYVYINNTKAVLGSKVLPGDVVEVRQAKKKEYVYFAYHKPRGVITHSPQSGEKSITEMIRRGDIFPIGRLDKDSSGLIILTNDGRITDRLLNPEYNHEKEYRVETDQKISNPDIKRLGLGIRIEGYLTKPAVVSRLNENLISIALTEGKKHQIRRMLAAAGKTVHSLVRVRIMNIKLGKLKENELRPIEGKELTEFLGSIDVSSD